MRPVGAALLLPAAAFAAGILFSDLLGPERVSLLAGLAVLALLWFLALRRVNWLRSVSCASVMLVTGALVATFHRPGPPPQLDAEPGEILLVAGCIVEPVEADGVQSRFVVQLEPGARVRVTLTAKPGETLPSLSYGQQVEVQAKVRNPRNFRNPGAFDYSGYLARQEIYWTATARGVANLRAPGGSCGTPGRRLALSLREGVTSRVQQLFRNDEYARRLLPALLTGDDATLDRSWTEDFRRTGTYHALVVSGLHIAVLAGTLLFLLRLLHLPLGATLLSGAVLAWGYAAVVNWQAPVVRSAAGFTLFLIARWFFRKGRVLNLLAAVGFVLLVWDPAAIYDPGFQLTFLSVAAIGGLAAPAADHFVRPYTDGLRRLNEPFVDAKLAPEIAEWRIELRLLAETLHLPVRVLSVPVEFYFWAFETALISACVQAALAVPLILYFHAFSVTGVFANITVVPALSAAVPVGLLACLTGLGLFTWPTLWLLQFARWSTGFWASVEPGLRIPDPPFWLVVFTAVAAAAAVRHRYAVLPFIAAVLLLVAAPFTPDLHLGDLELTAIDVGQGDSVLLVSPEGRTLLMDSGGTPMFDTRITPRLDIGEDVVSPYLWRRGLKRLDYVAISHLHEDHAGGMRRILANFRPAELWIGAVAPSKVWTEIQAACGASGTRIVSLRRGDARRLGSVSLQTLAPAGDYEPGNAPRNDDSLVLLARHGRHTFLLTGDAGAAVEREIRDSIPEIDVLKVAHHGSRSSTTPEFLEAARPLFSIISAGVDNPYGLPSRDTLDRLRSSGSRVERTDTDGMVTIRSDGKRLKIDTFDAEMQYKSGISGRYRE